MFVHYDKSTGEIKGIHHKEIQKVIPEPNLEISDEIAQYLLDKTKLVSVDVKTKAIKVDDLPPPSAKERTAEFVGKVKAECTRRIYSQASQSAQMNMTAAATAGLLDENQMNAYRAGLMWISSMQGACQSHIVNQNQEFALDEAWPVLPPEVQALVTAF